MSAEVMLVECACIMCMHVGACAHHQLSFDVCHAVYTYIHMHAHTWVGAFIMPVYCIFNRLLLGDE